MNIQTTIREWIRKRTDEEYIDLYGIQIAITGEEADVTPPFVGIYETGASIVETSGVTMYGVTDFEIAVELHTVPADEQNEGTPTPIEQGLREDLYDILGDRDFLSFGSGRNGWSLFDIRTASPITESGDGQRITRFQLLITACPFQPIT